MAGLAWTGTGFDLRWTYQFGAGTGANADRDVSHDVVHYTDGSGARYLYETGYTPAGPASDLRISRLRLTADGTPQVASGAVDHVQHLVGSMGDRGDNGAWLVVGPGSIWVAATMGGGRDHAGVCGTGNGTTDITVPPDGTLDTSSAEGHVFGFSHAGFVAATGPEQDFTVLAPPGAPAPQRSVNLEGLSYANGRFWATGSTTAAFASDSTAACGAITSEEYDDESDAIVFSLSYPNP